MSKDWVKDIYDMQTKYKTREWVENNPDKLREFLKFRIEFLTFSNCSADTENDELIPSFPTIKVPLMLNFFKSVESFLFITLGYLR